MYHCSMTAVSTEGPPTSRHLYRGARPPSRHPHRQHRSKHRHHRHRHHQQQQFDLSHQIFVDGPLEGRSDLVIPPSPYSVQVAPVYRGGPRSDLGVPPSPYSVQGASVYRGGPRSAIGISTSSHGGPRYWFHSVSISIFSCYFVSVEFSLTSLTTECL